MKFNSTTHWISVVTMGLYMLYILSALGFVGLIMSLAIALIVAAFVDSFELVTASVVVAGVAYVIISRWLGIRSSCKASEGFSDGTEPEITKLMDTLNKKKYGPDRVVTPDPWTNAWGPTGVLSSSVEGFDNPGTTTSAPSTDGQPGSSSPAPANTSTTLVNNLGNNLGNKAVTDTLAIAGAAASQAASQAASNAAKQMTTSPTPAQSSNTDSQPRPTASSATQSTTATSTTSGFTDGGMPGLFKLGELPSESKEGPHLDAGSTLMKAMSSLQPDQIKSMTSDTQALLQTQQNLMGMLQSMQPILKDGRKLLDTFSGIFGSEGGAGGSKAFNLGN